MTCRSGYIWSFIPIFANKWQPDYHLQLAILSTQIGHSTLGRLLAYVLQITFRVAEGVAGYVEAARKAKC